jgi:hypothetical protein
MPEDVQGFECVLHPVLTFAPDRDRAIGEAAVKPYLSVIKA